MDRSDRFAPVRSAHRRGFATVINERDEFFIAADIDGVAAAGREVIEDE